MAIEYRITGLREKLEEDLRDAGLTQRELVNLLSEEGALMTEQALSNWKRASTVPRRRWARLVEVLGPESRIAKSVSVHKVYPDPLPAAPGSIPESYAAHFSERVPPDTVSVVPKGTVRVAKYNPGHPATLVRQFEALLLKLPESNRVVAAQAAYQAMIPYLLDSASDQPELPGLE